MVLAANADAVRSRTDVRNNIDVTLAPALNDSGFEKVRGVNAGDHTPLQVRSLRYRGSHNPGQSAFR